MENSNVSMPPFYVGQKVVRVAEPQDSVIKKGDTFIVKDIKWCCDGYGWRIDIGVTKLEILSQFRCNSCKKPYTHTCAYLAKYFAPIEENFQSISYSEVLEKERPLVSAN